MALITCPECKKEVSDRAMSCPSCACPLERAVTTGATGKKWKGIQLVSLGAIFLGILVAFGTPIPQGGAYAGLMIVGGLIGLLAGTKVFMYLVAVYWGALLGLIIFLTG